MPNKDGFTPERAQPRVNSKLDFLWVKNIFLKTLAIFKK
jgi:hypothetical protein